MNYYEQIFRLLTEKKMEDYEKGGPFTPKPKEGKPKKPKKPKKDFNYYANKKVFGN